MMKMMTNTRFSHDEAHVNQTWQWKVYIVVANPSRTLQTKKLSTQMHHMTKVVIYLLHLEERENKKNNENKLGNKL